ncbi:cytochrome-c peroxidase [Rudanella lutea]|uniref:cytochrome-c peroxidase n=1 Tax=Rudanella lutea TaxID=451374 RepID=UPI0003689870|nr:cytochrome c peroxidase [Rudanella lutea]
MKRHKRILLGIAGLAFGTSVVLSCQSERQERLSRREPPDDISVLEALPLRVPEPTDNPGTPAKIELGRMLFYDPILSGGRDVACATCHHPDFGYAEFLPVSIGVNGEGTGSKRHFREPNTIPLVKRNSQSVLNAAFNGLTHENPVGADQAPMFWDLRASSLEKQALEPIKAFEEMRGHTYAKEVAPDSVVARLRRIGEYRRLFGQAFAGPEPVTVPNLARALAAYERTLVANNSRFDQFMRGDKSALSQTEQEGLALFLKSGCSKCHNGPMLSDFKLHTLGVADYAALPEFDAGPDNRYAFRTPTLRNLSRTAPYMHNGTLPDLPKVLMFYEDLSGTTIANPRVQAEQLDPLTKHLRVQFRDINTIIEFLNTLNDDSFDRTIPKRVPSGLRVGGNL